MDRSLHNWPGRLAKRLVSRLVRFQIHHQQQVNQTFARQIGSLLSTSQAATRECARLWTELEATRAELAELKQHLASRAESGASRDSHSTRPGGDSLPDGE